MNTWKIALVAELENRMFEHILTLSDALRNYYTADELSRMAEHYGVEPLSDYSGINYSALAEMLLTKPEIGRNREFLDSIISPLENRIDQAIANTDWEERTSHRSMWPRVKALIDILRVGAAPTEVTVRPSNPFTAKAEVRELVEIAKTPITIVDNYIGLGTLDCLRGAPQAISLLTGIHDHAIEKGLERHLNEFASEGREIEVRRHGKLHDRYILLNDRCWIIGSSLKDAGKKIFTMIELTDTHDTVIKDVELKWNEAAHFFP